MSRLFSCLFLVVAGMVNPATSFSQRAGVDSKEVVYQQINQERISRGLEPLPIDRKLARSAQSWAFFMPYKGRHNTNFIARRRAFKSPEEKEKIWGGEALAWSTDPVKSWLKSYRHAGIVLGPKAKSMGLGYWRGKWVLRTLTY